MNKALILAAIAIREMFGCSCSARDIKANVELTKEILK